MNFQNIYGSAATLRLIAVIAAAIIQTNPALASNEIITTSCSMLTRIKDWLFGAVYILGAMGLVLIAISAFLGRFKFAHLISLGGGLFVVAMSDALISFVTDAGQEDCSAGGTGDEGIWI